MNEVWKCDRDAANVIHHAVVQGEDSDDDIAEIIARHQAGVRDLLIKLGSAHEHGARTALSALAREARVLLASQRPAPEPEEDAR